MIVVGAARVYIENALSKTQLYSSEHLCRHMALVDRHVTCRGSAARASLVAPSWRPHASVVAPTPPPPRGNTVNSAGLAERVSMGNLDVSIEYVLAAL